MAQTISEVMTPDPRTLKATASAREAAQVMKDADVGPVIVLDDNDQVCGIVTDRDIAIRVVAEGMDPASTALDRICSHDMTALSPGDDAQQAARTMREKAIRRMPVVDNGKPVGIVSIGDLAIERDPDSALADISSKPANE